MKSIKHKASLDELLAEMSAKHRSVCNQIRRDFSPQFDLIPGSGHNHQNWQGGYRDHLEEVLNIAIVLYTTLNSLRPLPFSLENALFVLFLHDIDKLLRYKVVNGQIIKKKNYGKGFISQIKNLLSDNYDYSLSKTEENALRYTHGEGSDYASTRRVMNELATLVHCCDNISARIWFDKGKDDRYW